MTTLTMTRGLPASGKSTWARAEVLGAKPGSLVAINKDLLRTMLHADRWDRKNEPQIIKARNALIETFLSQGVSVIVDDTNFNPTHERYLMETAKRLGAQFQIKDFSDADVDVCIQRDLARAKSVGEAVIRGMWNEYVKVVPTPPEFTQGAPLAIIVDIDGTVADMGNRRGPFQYELVSGDEPVETIIGIVRLAALSYEVIYLSGREDSCRVDTKAWLDKHVGIDGELFMRATKDGRKDFIVKHEIYQREIAGKYNIVFVLDDRTQVVNMWRDTLGITCLQVAPGDF